MFDPDFMETEKVIFLSDIYFDLAESTPDLASSFALGTDVIVVHGDLVYEVIGDEANTEWINETQLIPTEPVIQITENYITPQPTQPTTTQPGTAGSTNLPCLSGLIITMFPLMAVTLVALKRSDKG
jgi:hypothetical protein